MYQDQEVKLYFTESRGLSKYLLSASSFKEHLGIIVGNKLLDQSRAVTK